MGHKLHFFRRCLALGARSDRVGTDEALYSVIEAATVRNGGQLNLAPANCQRGSEERKEKKKKNDISEVREDVWKTTSPGHGC